MAVLINPPTAAERPLSAISRAATAAPTTWSFISVTPIGQVVQGKTQDVTYSYNYDNAHRVASVTDTRGNKQLSYAYSNAGLLLMTQDSDGNRTDYDYDPTGRLTGI